MSSALLNALYNWRWARSDRCVRTIRRNNTKEAQDYIDATVWPGSMFPINEARESDLSADPVSLLFLSKCQQRIRKIRWLDFGKPSFVGSRSTAVNCADSLLYKIARAPKSLGMRCRITNRFISPSLYVRSIGSTRICNNMGKGTECRTRN
jgi:hypothetical protein